MTAILGQWGSIESNEDFTRDVPTQMEQYAFFMPQDSLSQTLLQLEMAMLQKFGQ